MVKQKESHIQRKDSIAMQITVLPKVHHLRPFMFHTTIQVSQVSMWISLSTAQTLMREWLLKMEKQKVFHTHNQDLTVMVITV
jgi:hypothetical protein